MITNEVAIQIGDKTHHQDQSILPSSFRVIKTIVSSPVKPIPEDEEEPDLLILFKFIVVNWTFTGLDAIQKFGFIVVNLSGLRVFHKTYFVIL